VTAAVYVALQKKDAALQWLERARDERPATLHHVGIMPKFAPLRSDNRFVSILQEIGLEPEKAFITSTL
jgi:hypothetical protein